MTNEEFKQLIEAPSTNKEDFLERICTKGIIQRTIRIALQYPEFAQEYLDSLPKAVNEIYQHQVKNKNMTREEQINNKAHELGQICFPNEHNIWARENYEAQMVEWACKQMAEWADEHPCLCEEEQVGVGELGMVWQKKALIEKSCEYLRTHLWQHVDDDNDPIIESVHNITLNNFIKDFKRYLEE